MAPAATTPTHAPPRCLPPFTRSDTWSAALSAVCRSVEIREDGSGEAHVAAVGTVVVSRADKILCLLARPLAEPELL